MQNHMRGSYLDELNILVGEADVGELVAMHDPLVVQHVLQFDALVRINVQHLLHQILHENNSFLHTTMHIAMSISHDLSMPS